jgi:peptidoglycan/LPS O-acetylase OafA/YrhL
MQTTESAWKLGHRPALDGLRGVAILLVLVCHVLDPLRPGAFHTVGAAGVTVFFTLSGFLITSLLLEEVGTRRRRVDLRRFYINRALRLIPALIAAVVVLVAISSLATGYVPNPWPTLLYGANWVEAFGGTLPYFGPTWSLSIEEQFYFLWPLLLIASSRWTRGPLVVAGAGIAASTVLRFALYDGGAGSLRVYYGTDTQASTLLVGCVLAMWVHHGLREPTGTWVVPAGLVGLSSLVLVHAYAVGDLWVPTLVPLVAAAMIWEAAHRPRGPLMASALRYVGRRSYAIYLWHVGLLWLVALAAGGASLLTGLVGLGLTLVVAEASWQLVERPFMRLKSRRSGGETDMVVDPAPGVGPFAIPEVG